MPRFTGEQLKSMFKTDPKGTSHEVVGALMREFFDAFPGDVEVENEIAAQLGGAKPSNLKGSQTIQRYLTEGFD
jgi:hypothetical protein